MMHMKKFLLGKKLDKKELICFSPTLEKKIDFNNTHTYIIKILF